ncbi:OmpH family outer membrane protein [Massilia sp. ST3]|uniref:OmpH family outer membrane protein n=1 Tax=Massilia sp. ST3 TaxID=2824903 RepID=UPI001B82FFDA|nr:OmpH family outer membrane protein [Massilia sp. ST3]MBQ5946781.1 OmpH family outer membrane protein [Massilia sp. ST3]
MLKNLIASLPRGLVIAALCAAPLAQAQAQGQAPSGRIGFVFTERLMTESKMAKAADAKLASEFSSRQKAVEEAAERFNAARKKFENEANSLNEGERGRRTRDLINLEADWKRMHNLFQEDLMQRKNEERAAIAQKAYKLLEQVAAEEKLDAVLAEAAWVNPRIDITDKILKLLDASK